MTALVNAASLAVKPRRSMSSRIYVIDEVSESMLADFLSVVPQTPSLMLITYRPEYRGRVGPGGRGANDSPCAAE